VSGESKWGALGASASGYAAAVLRTWFGAVMLLATFVGALTIPTITPSPTKQDQHPAAHPLISVPLWLCLLVLVGAFVAANVHAYHKLRITGEDSKNALAALHGSVLGCLDLASFDILTFDDGSTRFRFGLANTGTSALHFSITELSVIVASEKPIRMDFSDMCLRIAPGQPRSMTISRPTGTSGSLGPGAHGRSAWRAQYGLTPTADLLWECAIRWRIESDGTPAYLFLRNDHSVLREVTRPS
jgi:hypothetical protein